MCIASTMVLVCCVFTALKWNSTGACNIAVSAAFSPSAMSNSTVPPSQLQCASLGCSFRQSAIQIRLPWCHSCWRIGSVPYIESFYCSQNLSCGVFLVPAGKSGQTWVHVHTSNTEWIQQIMFIYLFTYMCNNNN